MSLIRVGFIGLSPGAWAASAHLPYLQSPESKFKIVAVCNSSVESARRAVQELGLGEGVRTYGDPQDLANDEDVELVVCTVRVDRHFATALPCLKAGKNVLVEWPLGKNLAEAQELLAVSKAHNVKIAAVGLQGRFDTGVQALKEILADERIGRVLSTTVVSQGGVGGPTELEKYRYLIDRESGGSLLTIPASHLLDAMREVLGDFSTFHSLLSNQRPVVKIIRDDGSVLDPAARKTSPDTIMIHGTLTSGTVLSASILGGLPFKGTPGLEWRILGDRGEIRVTGPSMHIQLAGCTSIEVHDFERDVVETVELRDAMAEELRGPLKGNLAREYEALAAGGSGVLCDFEGAVRRHELIEEIYRQNPGL